MSEKNAADRRFEVFDDEIKLRYFNEQVSNSIPVTHQHSKYEIYFAPDAVPGSIHVNSNDISWNTPCVLIVYPYMLHSPIRTVGKTHERYYVSLNERTVNAFDERLVPSVLKEKNSCCLFTLTQEQGKVLREVLDTVGDFSEASERQKELVFMLFMAKLCEICEKDKIQKFDTMSSYIFDVMKYISENYCNGISSTELAKRFSISRSKLERNFRVATGYSVHSFIDNCRMNQAMRQLSSDKFVSVHKVAEACGFENETYFYLFFKKHAEMSPLEFRKLKIAENKNEK